MRVFSSRRESITTELRARAARFEQRHGRAPSQRELAQLAQASNLATRKGKEGALDLAQAHAHWADKLARTLGVPLASVAPSVWHAAGATARGAQEGGVVPEELALARAARQAAALAQQEKSTWTRAGLVKSLGRVLPHAVAMGEAERIRPPADLLPAESAVEVFESFSAPCLEPELFQTQFVTGNVADTVHQRGADTAAAEVGMGLNALDHAPVRNDAVPVSAQAQPPSEDAVELGEQEPAVLGIKIGDELNRDCAHVVETDRGKREADGSAVVGHGHPAVDEFARRLGCHVLWALGLNDLDQAAIGSGWQRHKVSRVQVGEVRFLAPDAG